MFNRRIFLHRSGLVGVGAILSAPAIWTSRNSLFAAGSSKVTVCRAESAPDREKLRWMLNRQMRIITGSRKDIEGWRKLFKPGESIGIKINALAGRKLSTSVELVHVLIKELIKAGIKPDSIIVWDRMERELTHAGFKINKGKGIKYIGTDSLGRGGYNGGIEFAGEVGSIFSDLMSLCDAHINMPVLKDHDLAGLSMSMKNWYGSIHNPNKYHDNNCSPFVADLSRHHYIKKRQRLIIVDALLVQPHGGPAYKPRWAEDYHGLLISRDPVAIDTIGLGIIDELRKKRKLKSLSAEKRYPKYLPLAEKYGLGRFDLSAIKKIEVQA